MYIQSNSRCRKALTKPYRQLSAAPNLALLVHEIPKISGPRAYISFALEWFVNVGDIGRLYVPSLSHSTYVSGPSEYFMPIDWLSELLRKSVSDTLQCVIRRKFFQ